MVKQKFYAGLIDIEGKEVGNVIDGIISLDELELSKENYIFLQKLKYPECGKIMGATHSLGAQGKKTFWYYQCSSCKKRNINEEKMEKMVISEIIDYYMITDVSTIYTSKQKRNDIDITTYSSLIEVEKRKSE